MEVSPLVRMLDSCVDGYGIEFCSVQICFIPRSSKHVGNHHYHPPIFLRRIDVLPTSHLVNITCKFRTVAVFVTVDVCTVFLTSFVRLFIICLHSKFQFLAPLVHQSPLLDSELHSNFSQSPCR